MVSGPPIDASECVPENTSFSNGQREPIRSPFINQLVLQVRPHVRQGSHPQQSTRVRRSIVPSKRLDVCVLGTRDVAYQNGRSIASNMSGVTLPELGCMLE